jgi:hypothetical protein
VGSPHRADEKPHDDAVTLVTQRLDLSRPAAAEWIDEKIAKAAEPIRDLYAFVKSCVDNGRGSAVPSKAAMNRLGRGEITEIVFDVGPPRRKP